MFLNEEALSKNCPSSSDSQFPPFSRLKRSSDSKNKNIYIYFINLTFFFLIRDKKSEIKLNQKYFYSKKSNSFQKVNRSRFFDLVSYLKLFFFLI